MTELQAAIRDFLHALDRGYLDSRLLAGGSESAFVQGLRDALAKSEVAQ
jgi:hypothetical protein